VVLLKIHVFLDVMLCSLISITYCYLQTEKKFTAGYDFPEHLSFRSVVFYVRLTICIKLYK
jgi:hypothetical protein